MKHRVLIALLIASLAATASAQFGGVNGFVGAGPTRSPGIFYAPSQTMVDADLTINPNTSIVFTSVDFSVSRVLTIPNSNAVPIGQTISFNDSWCAISLSHVLDIKDTGGSVLFILRDGCTSVTLVDTPAGWATQVVNIGGQHGTYTWSGYSATTVSNAVTNYIPAEGGGTPQAVNEALVMNIFGSFPQANIGDLACVLTNATTGALQVAGGTNYTMTSRINGGNGSNTCTIGAAQSSCEDPVNNQTVNDLDRIDIAVSPSGTPTAAVVHCSISFYIL